ncbi:FecR domain-containing protein [Ottowia sp.]|uniref:FecR domain-containing protein n=1 Tax=Ottowia sp. TaxID=1898956 RepID=UPI003A873B09
MSLNFHRVLVGTVSCIALLGAQMAIAQTAVPDSTTAPVTPAATPVAAELPVAETSLKEPPTLVPTPGDAREGTFKTVRGEVTVVRNNTRMAAVVGGGLKTSDTILTGTNSAAAVTLKDGTVLSVGPDSSVDLKDFAFNSTTQDGNVLVNLMRGTLRMATGLIAKVKPQNVKVTTPTTVVGVRGTDFIVEANPS